MLKHILQRPPANARKVLQALQSWRSIFKRQRNKDPLHFVRVGDLLASGDREMEAVFLTLGEHFEPLSRQMNGLVESRHELSDLASGRKDGMTLFQEALDLLHQPLLHLDRLGARHDELMRLLQDCEERTTAMLRFQAEIQDTLAPLSYIEVLFKVEAAGLPSSEQDTFFAVSGEIARLRQSVNETFQENLESLRTTRDTLRKVRLEHGQSLARRSGEIRQEREKMDRALDRLDADLQRNVQHDEHTEELSLRLAQTIEQVVLTAQAQDIISQKSAHVREILRKLQDSRKQSAHLEHLAHQQLALINNEIAKAHAEFEGGVKQITALADQIDSHALHHDGYDSTIASADGMVQILLDACSDVRQMLSDTNRIINESYDAARPAGNIVQNISATLVEVSINMHHIALNAQVRSEQISSGTGLSTLASRTADISVAITEIGDHVTRDLEELRETTQRLFRLFEEFQSGGREHMLQLEARSAPVEKRLHEFRDRTLMVFNGISEAVAAVRYEAKSAATSVSLLEDCAQHFHAAFEMLGSDLAALDKKANLSTSEKQALDEHARRYSMHTERQVHAALTGDEEVAAHDDSSTDVDLFDQAFFADLAALSQRVESQVAKMESDQSKSGKPVPAANSRVDDNVEFF